MANARLELIHKLLASDAAQELGCSPARLAALREGITEAELNWYGWAHPSDPFGWHEERRRETPSDPYGPWM